LYARRRGDTIKGAIALEGLRSVRAGVASPTQVEEVRALIALHEGAPHAARFMRVYATQPERLYVITEISGRVLAVSFMVAIHRLPPELIEGDPILERAREVRAGLVTREGEGELVCARWWFTRSG